MIAPLDLSPDVTLRRRSRTILGLVGAATIVVLILTVFVQIEASAGRAARLAFAIASLTLTAALLAVLVVEVRRRVRNERVVARADQALRHLSHADEVGPDDRALPEVLETLTTIVAVAMDAERVTLSFEEPLQIGTEATTTSGPIASGDPTGLLTVALVCERVPIGALRVVARPGRTFDAEDRLLLQVMAPRVAAQVERERLGDAERRSRLAAEQARRQVDVLARASVPLAPALENPEVAITEIANAVVPEFADLFAVDLLRADGRLERIVAASRDPSIAIAFPEMSSSFPSWSDTLRRVMASGESELAFFRTAEDDPSTEDAFAALMHSLGLQSWVVAAICVRGESLGTMTLATQQGRRGFRLSDQLTINDLVARSSMAFERGFLYQEARQAAVQASQRADQLSRMVEATIVLTRTLAPAALLDTLVEQARYVLDAPYAHAQLGEPHGTEAESGPRTPDPVRISSPLVGPLGETTGHLTVERPSGATFGQDAAGVITMLAESASIASRNAVLYQDVQSREQRLQTLIGASPLAILELDTTGEVLVANPAASALFPVCGPDATELVRPPAALVEGLAELMTSTVRGERHDVELITTDPAGKRRDLWVSTAPVSGDDVGSVRMLAVITDMTERKRLEEQLASSQRFEAIANLAGGVAHDFNNLLTVILGYSEILLNDLPDHAAEREFVEAIQEAGNHAAVITNQLLALSRHQVLQPETIDAVARCAALMPMLRRLAGDQVTIEARLEGTASIRVDPGQLEQVLFNLVFNSRDAMPKGGHLDIEAGKRIQPNGTDTVFVRVTDNGEGMDADTVARCQEPFFTTKGRSRGIGLGLATVASIMQRSGGTLEISSEPGCGTSMTVTFPSADAAGTPPISDVGEEPGRRVLLIDDDDQVRHFTARVLAQGGYRVTHVGDGENAIRLVEAEGDFDLLVTDVVLPGMSGADVVRTVRRRWPLIACLLITGYADAQSLHTDVSETMLLAKPFTPEDLLNAVARAQRAAAQGLLADS